MIWPTDNNDPTRVKSSILNEAQNQSVMHHSGLFTYNWDTELVPGQIEFFFYLIIISREIIINLFLFLCLRMFLFFLVVKGGRPDDFTNLSTDGCKIRNIPTHSKQFEK